MKKQILAMNLDFLLEIVTATALIFVATWYGSLFRTFITVEETNRKSWNWIMNTERVIKEEAALVLVHQYGQLPAIIQLVFFGHWLGPLFELSSTIKIMLKMANFYSQMMCRLLFNTSSRKNKNITRFVVRKFLDVYNVCQLICALSSLT